MTATRLSGPFGLEVQIAHEPHSVFGDRPARARRPVARCQPNWHASARRPNGRRRVPCRTKSRTRHRPSRPETSRPAGFPTPRSPRGPRSNHQRHLVAPLSRSGGLATAREDRLFHDCQLSAGAEMRSILNRSSHAPRKGRPWMLRFRCPKAYAASTFEKDDYRR